jgi:hypothetical protein
MKALLFMNVFALVTSMTLLPQTLHAQVDSTQSEQVLHRVVKFDGREYIGVLLSDDGREVLIETEQLGKIYIPKADIESIALAKTDDSLIRGKFRESGPFTTRYYFTNNALPIRKGEHYVMVHLYGPEVHFAVADRLSVGIMATWIASPIGLAVKYAIPTANDRLNFSVGSIVLSSGYLFQSQGFGGLHWASASYGRPGKNFTISGGYAYADLGFDNRHDLPDLRDRVRQGPVLGVAALLPVGEKASFLFDSMTFLTVHHNYHDIDPYAPGNGGPATPILLWHSGDKVSTVLMPGMRFQRNARSAFQIALAGVIEYSSIGFDYESTSGSTRSLPIPMCSWFIKL